MAVDEGAQTGGVGDYLTGGPGRALRIDAAVAHCHHVVRAGGLGRVDGALDGLVEAVLAEAVSIVAVFVLEVGRSRLGISFGGADAHVSHCGIAVLNRGKSVVYRLFGGKIHEIAGYDLGLQRGKVFLRLRHTVVELMVAGDHYVVAHSVHKLHKILAVGKRGHGGAL